MLIRMKGIDLEFLQKRVNNAWGYKKYQLEHYNGKYHIVKYKMRDHVLVCQTTVRGGMTKRDAYEFFYAMCEAIDEIYAGAHPQPETKEKQA